MDFLATFATTYLEARAPEDDRVLRKCLRAISAIGDTELGGRKVHYRVACELARHAIASLSGSRGQYLVDGVVVSSFLPMRAIPFRVVFVAGLGERHFPAVEDEDHLDLRSAHRRAGDVGSRDRDRYLFLETLLAARDRLYLSYPIRDELTSDPLSPSSVVSELRATLLNGYVREEELSTRSHVSPRSEDPRTRRAVPEAAREKKAQSLGEHLRSQLGVARLPPLARLKRQLPANVLGWLRCPPPPPRRTSVRGAMISLRLDELREFLECPLQGSARFHLRMLDETAPVDFDRENERSHRTVLDRHRLLVEAFRRGGGVDAYDDAARHYETRGVTAARILRGSERRRNLAILASWQSGLRELTNGTEPRVDGREESVRPPLVLTVDGRRVELLRRPALRLETPRALLGLASKDPERFHPQKDSLKGFLDHVYASAAGASGDEPYLFLAINAPPRGERRSTAIRFAPVARDRAVAYLETIVSDLLSGAHEYVLPCESVFSERHDVKLDRTSTAHGPVPHPEDYEPPDDETRAEIVARRFGLYFDILLPPGETS
jgi:exodeoxyribonuclease V gamma subunit